MSLRDNIRRIRLYYKSLPLIFSALELPLLAFALPFMHAKVRFRSKSGFDLDVPPWAWHQLPNMCRLARIGASCRFEADCKRIELDGFTFFSPLEAKAEGDNLREIFREDVYRMKDRAFEGKVVVDIGAYFGDSSIPMAKKGATVYAFEPSVTTGELLRRNLAANDVGDAVRFFNAGLCTRTRKETAGGEVLNFVDGIPFLLANVPRSIDLLKIDCEGCEYPLFEDGRFLDHLAPAEIVMEYHQGEKRLAEILENRAYTVEIIPCGDKVGYIYARRVSPGGL
jgi:Met-10+ like-protein